MEPISSDMWRLELLHPMLVHFPIALLTVATLFELVSVMLSNDRRRFLRSTSLILFILGTVTAWLGVWAGEEAEEIIEHTLCDTHILELHETWGSNAAWIFTVVSVLALLRWKLIGSPVFSGILILLAMAGAASIGYAGHLGATLVYQHGAAVQRPVGGAATVCVSSKSEQAGEAGSQSGGNAAPPSDSSSSAGK